jgi:cell wall-associated NlpC family hydrolase
MPMQMQMLTAMPMPTATRAVPGSPTPPRAPMSRQADSGPRLCPAHAPELAHAPLADVRRGDLVLWRSKATGMVHHVAMSLGGSEVIEAVEPQVHLAAIGDRATQVMMPVVVRPFPPRRT